MPIFQSKLVLNILFLEILFFTSFISIAWTMGDKPAQHIEKLLDVIALPNPVHKGNVSVEEALNSRRTKRNFSSSSLSLEDWAQLLWAAQGITSEDVVKKRTAPSAGALYPLDIYLILGKHSPPSLGPGVYHYQPERHALRRLSDKDILRKLAEASLHQYWMAEASGMIVITAEYKRITGKYGNRGIRYAHIEVGHVAQNCFLQGESLGLGVGIVGAFDDESIIQILNIPKTHEPILILPVGRKE